MASHAKVAHAWAHQNYSRRGSLRGCNMIAEGDALYSYGAHFCIGRVIEPGRFYVLNSRRYSVTTAKHQSRARSAIPHGATVVYVPGAACGPSDHAANRAYFTRSRDASMASMAGRRAARLALHDYRAARDVVRQANAYAEQFRQPWRLKMPTVDAAALEALEAKARDQERAVVERRQRERREWESRNAERAAQQHAERVRRAAELDATRAERVRAWRAGESSDYIGDVPPMLRISADGERIETSHHASVTLADGRAAIAYIADRLATVPADELPITYGHGEVRAGLFSILEIGRERVIVGCHYFETAEIARMAAALGVEWPQ